MALETLVAVRAADRGGHKAVGAAAFSVLQDLGQGRSSGLASNVSAEGVAALGMAAANGGVPVDQVVEQINTAAEQAGVNVSATKLSAEEFKKETGQDLSEGKSALQISFENEDGEIVEYTMEVSRK
jgi:hypothetical protein